MQRRVVDGLKMGTGAFANGQTYQSHPAASAAGLSVMKIFETDKVVENCAERGAQVSPTPPARRANYSLFYTALGRPRKRRWISS